MVRDVIERQGALLVSEGEMGQDDPGQQQAAAALEMPVWPRPPDPGCGEKDERDERGG